jgi:hypothetical protein
MRLLNKLNDVDPLTNNPITTIPFRNNKTSLEGIETAVENDLKLIQSTFDIVHTFVFSSDDLASK